MIKKVKDPISSLTHLAGMVAAIPCLVILIIKAYEVATVWHIVSFAIFGVALVLLYAASGFYHMLIVSKKKEEILHKIDHMMIFVLIAGTYTPICLIPLRGVWGWSMLAIVWSFAVAGMILKVFYINAPRWLSSGIYVLMGWIVVYAFFPLIKTVPFGGVVLLVAGGVSYTVGAIVYALKWPRFKNKWFGFHELFHLFVLGGSVLHFLFMYNYVLYA